MPDTLLKSAIEQARAQRRLCLRSLLVAAAFPLLSSRNAGAAPPANATAPSMTLRQPTQAVALTVSGQLRLSNRDGRAEFDLPMLAALPQVSHLTATPWYKGSHTFTGPLLRDVLSQCGAHGEVLRLKALNDFRMDMPMSDAQKHDVILAHLLDGKPMSVRDKGPLFVIYPFSDHAELRSMVYYVRSVWQLNAITVL